MKAASLLVLLPLLLACSPQSGPATENQVTRATATDSHATEAAATDSHAGEASAPDGHTGEEPTGVAKPAPMNGWATDAPLREGMGRIRKSVDALGHYEHGHLGAEHAGVVAADVEKDVNFIIANCKLDPDADAALHGVIAQLLKGAHALKADPADLAAMEPMRAAMTAYARGFDDPAFRTKSAKR